MGQCKQCGKYLTPAETGLPCPDCGSSDRVIASFDLGSSIEVAEAAEALARKHYEIEAGLTQIFRIIDTAEAADTRGAPIKLLEVNSNYTRVGHYAFALRPGPGQRHPIRISHHRDIAK